mmetsp:Transcript_20737/g.34242  ORF Transcript_20737/g.34242 Transcript_20737/m.34242 type:complete len:572 (-) Transcript_20737:30-1745(-)|eukprot:CAMPEP_0203745146 /NCGR_PEP_ID=MMETSP0098-20131031/984_1 /ASSEMBLY_ACC=CAM_ASM_000208 /TAXON_ID=96639 /ORGANISM=" , Strain NY0313808BC1" /LENGTH=571 /DNA_ID=CAMNT_0050632847 /DNA_START=200 /DNA_END=1915 /DNA_ORIENTATION=-
MGQTFSRWTRQNRLPYVALFVAMYRYKRGFTDKNGTVLELFTSLMQGRNTTLRMLGDVIGIYLITSLARRVVKLRRAIHTTTFSTLKDTIGSGVVEFLKKTPVASKLINSEFSKMEKDIETKLKSEGREQHFVLPAEGMPRDLVISKMKNLHEKEVELWEDGWVSGAVYHGGEEHIKMQNKAFDMFSISNPLHADIWPSVMQFEAEVVSMTANLLNGGVKSVCGTMTSGGTESIIMAAKTHREWALKTKGITEPEIVAPQTAHAGIDKACELLGIKLVQVPVNQVTFQVDPKAMERYITSDTIMLYSSSPQYPHGIIDPIEQLSKLALKYGLGLHVDCCLGGYVLPFAKKLGYEIPPFNFELPGVTSLSVDTHKYGYAAKGTSVILYRTPELRHFQYFTYPNWPGGLYVTPSTAGSRPGGLSAACWASLMAMGEKGFLDATKEIMEAQRRIKKAVQSIKGLKLMGDPVAMIVAIGSDDFNIYSFLDKMHAKGWTLNALQHPPCLHMCVTLRSAPHADRFIRDCESCAEDILANPNSVSKGGNAPMYGMAAAMPNGPVEDMLRTYTDVVLKV